MWLKRAANTLNLALFPFSNSESQRNKDFPPELSVDDELLTSFRSVDYK